jgi:hypothetical protein
MPPGDTGMPPADTGMPPADTGTPDDTGMPPGDTGMPPADTGMPPTDTGMQPTDTGMPPTDTGMQPTDAGTPTDTGTGACMIESTRPCYTGGMGTQGVGRCRGGTQVCLQTGEFSACEGEVTPASSEVCGNMMDDDCNGMVDEGCGECLTGETRPCYTGPTGTQGMGRCRAGTQACSSGGMFTGACMNEVLPAMTETCGNMIDDDCDGMVDEGCGECQPGATRMCYTGPTATRGVGRCVGGIQVCGPSGSYGSACVGEVVPAMTETCGNMTDDDCNGMVDDGCGECTPGA